MDSDVRSAIRASMESVLIADRPGHICVVVSLFRVSRWRTDKPLDPFWASRELRPEVKDWFDQQGVVEEWSYNAVHRLAVFIFPPHHSGQAIMFKLAWGGL